MAITVAMINDLRQRTNAGMMDCKKALTSTNGDMDAAIKVLREKGLAIQVKRADKESKEGIIQSAASADGKTIAMVEVNTETDFVAKTDNFKKFTETVAAKVLEIGEDLGDSLKEEHMTIVSQTGENVKVRRTARYVQSGTGKIESYIHMGGKVGVLVEVACEKEETVSNPAFVELVHDISLQVAASAPRFLNTEEVPQSDIDAELDVRKNQLIEQKGKLPPEKILAGVLKGMTNKFFSEICLVRQPFIKEPKQSITDVLAACEKATGDKITIKRFVRFQLGA